MTFDEQYDPVDIEDYLAHYGRKGMKWYEHIFGRLQEHAKYAKEKRAQKKVNEAQKKLDAIRKREQIERNYKKISDEELKRRIERLKNEEEYLELTRKTRKVGKRVTIQILAAIGKGSLKAIEGQSTIVTNKALGRLVQNIFKDDKNKDGNQKKE